MAVTHDLDQPALFIHTLLPTAPITQLSDCFPAHEWPLSGMVYSGYRWPPLRSYPGEARIDGKERNHALPRVPACSAGYRLGWVAFL